MKKLAVNKRAFFSFLTYVLIELNRYFLVKGAVEFMNEHYYSKNPSVQSNRKMFTYHLRDKEFRFMTDAGVFSKNEVDFGSRLLIETFQVPSVNGDILDVGCGYGPIGLSIAATEASRTIDMIDINERAIELAKENSVINKIENVRIIQSHLFEQLDHKQYAAILTNPPIRAGKQIVHEILEQSFHHLLPNGELWVVIQKKQGAPSAIKKMEELFPNVEVVNKKKGYYIIKAKKIDY